MAVDVLDIIVLVVILLVTSAYFTKGVLWSKPVEVDKFADGFGSKSNQGDNDTRDIIENLEKNGKNVVVFFGSQTGTAEDYSSRLAKEGSSRFGLKTMVADVEDYDFENLDKFPEDKVACFVMATYGEGDPTDNAVQFYEFITSPDVMFSEEEDAESKPLSNLNYVIFGLGNNTYEHFNAIGRGLDKALQNLGAHRIGPYGEGDDGDGTMEEDYIAWKDEMFARWQQEKNLEEHEAVYEPTIALTETGTTSQEEDDQVFVGELNKRYLEGNPIGPYGSANPYLAEVKLSKELFSSDSRNCIHLELDISGSGLRYTTGDHLAFWAQNSSREVDRFLRVLGLDSKKNSVVDVKTLDPTAKIHFPVPTTYDTIARYYLEINGSVSRQFISSIAPFAPNEEAKKNALKLGSDKEAFAKEVTHKFLNTARLLEQLSNDIVWDKVPFNFIIESISHLQPRYYSISSSSLVNRNIISITAVVESHKAEDAEYVLKGVATNYILDLKRLHNNEVRPIDDVYNVEGPRGKYVISGITKAPIHVRHSNFKLPSNPQKPIIMIGPGTGIAPFRGFIHERAAKAAQGAPVGMSLLFFGCRRSTEDFLYADEWKKYSNQPEGENQDTFQESNFLKVITAFSRDGPSKVYVQHRLEEHSALVDGLLRKGAFLYVCGDAMRMARDVQTTLARIISKHRNIPVTKAEDIIKNLKVQNIYQEDVW